MVSKFTSFGDSGCGNFEEKRENEETYSGGADATAFRVLVWVASKFDWVGCIIDIKTAFLNAEMEVTEDENDLLILPPSIMTEKGYLPRNTVLQATEGGVWIPPIASSVGKPQRQSHERFADQSSERRK